MKLFLKKPLRFFLCFLMILSGFSGLAGSIPVVYGSGSAPFILKNSEEVKPGEAISIYGEYMSSALHTHVYLVENSNQDLTIQQQESNGRVIRVILPSTVAPGAYTLKVSNDNGYTDTYVNIANPRWISDMKAYAGMQLELMGRNLDASLMGSSSATQVRLVPVAGGANISAVVNKITSFAVTFTIPSSGLSTNAAYYVEVNNNAGTTTVGTAWYRLKQDGTDTQITYTGASPTDATAQALGVSWSKDFNWGNQKNVKSDFGAKGDGLTDDTTSIQNGINWLNSNGGGVLNIPDGTYKYTNLSMKTGVILSGASRANTILKSYVTGGTAITGTSQSLMGMSDLQLTVNEAGLTSNFRLIDSYGDPWAASPLQSTRIFFYDVYFNESLTNSNLDFQLLIGAQKQVLIANCKFYGRTGTTYSPYIQSYFIMRNNTFDYAYQFILMAASQAIFENNTITGHVISGVSDNPIPNLHGLAMNPSTGWPIRDVYANNNTIANMGAGGAGASDGEIMQAEPPSSGMMMGAVTSASSNTVTLNKEYTQGASWSQQWQALVVKGTGLGQLRNVTAHTDNGSTMSVTVDKNWDVQPDTTSKVIIRRVVSDVVFSNTAGSQSTWGLVFYNVAYDSVIADNTLSNTQGAQTDSFINTADLIGPSYFVQLKRNTTSGKNTGASQLNDSSHLSTWIGAPFESRWQWAPTGQSTDAHYAVLNYGTEIKNNTINRSGSSSVADWGNWGIASAIPLEDRTYDSDIPASGVAELGPLVEGNLISNSDYGINVGKGVDSAFIKGNTYTNVTNAKVYDGGSTNKVVYSDDVAAPTPTPTPTPTATPTPTGTPSPTPTPPPGLTNVAANVMPATSSSITIGTAAMITDGQSNNPDNYAGLNDTGVQWMKLDLGFSSNISDIKLWHYYGDTRTYHDVIVQLSNTADFSSGVTTVFNNDTDNSAGQGTGTDTEYAETSSGKDISFAPVNARYVRFWSNGSTLNGWSHYTEAQVWGTGGTSSSVSLATQVVNLDPSNLRNDPDSTGDGMQVTIGAQSLSVTHLGKYYFTGDSSHAANTGVFDLKIIKASDNSVAGTAQINMSQGSPDSLSFKYAALATPVTLSASTTYYVVAVPVAGSDYFYDAVYNGNLITTSAAAVEHAIWSSGSPVTYNQFRNASVSYGPLNFKYAAGSAGYRNLAAGIMPASSTTISIGNGAMITDGETANSDNYAGLFSSGPQWIQVDLGAIRSVDTIKLWHYYTDARTYHDVIVQLSNTADFSSGVTTVFNNDTDNSSGQGTGTGAEYAEASSGKTITFTTANARYIRFWSNGSTANVWSHYVEAQVWGQ